MKSETVQKSKTERFDAAETKLVYLLADIENPLSIGDAGERAGYSRQYAYEKARTPKIRDAVDALIAERVRDHARQTEGLLWALAQRGLAGDNFAAKLYLDAMGRGATGVRIVNNVTANAGDQFQDRVKRIFGERGVLDVLGGADEEVVEVAATGNDTPSASGNGDGPGHPNE